MGTTNHPLFRYLMILGLAGIFILLFVENWVMSDSWGILPLREIDDYALHLSIRRFQELFLNHQWSQLATFFDYAYGTGFWFFNSILLFPCYFLDNAQCSIVMGRELMLVFAFACLFVLGKILDRLFGKSDIKYLVLFLTAFMPAFSLFTTKFHVNIQYTLWGLLAFYLLIRKDTLHKKELLLSSLFCGLMVGFKILGAFLAPALGLTLLWRLSNQKKLALIKWTSLYVGFSVAVASITMYPMSLAFPFSREKLNRFVQMIQYFQQLGTDATATIWELITVGFAGYFFPPLFFLLLFALGYLAFKEYKENRNPITWFVFGNVWLIVLLLVLVVKKHPSYTIAYFIGLSFFVNLGFYCFKWIKVPRWVFIVTVVSFISLDSYYNWLSHKAYSLRYFELPQQEWVQLQFKAYDDLVQMIPKASQKTRVLRDWSSAFPLTGVDRHVDERLNYWNLANYKTEKFDYIILNNKHYALGAPPEQELKDRAKLKKGELLYGNRYQLIYSENEVEVHQLVSDQSGGE